MQTAQVVVIEAAAMKRGLDTEGRVALYEAGRSGNRRVELVVQ